MRTFCLQLFVPLGILIIALFCEILMHRFGLKRNWSYWRLKISMLPIRLATAMILAWYILSIVDGRIRV